MPSPDTLPYVPLRAARPVRVPVRGLSYHCLTWGDPSLVRPDRPALILAHGFMDLGASFQFVVDALHALEGHTRYIVAPDWRGFGHTVVPQADNFWFPDYLGDLDALLAADALGLDDSRPVDLVGHSMGGNVVMSYAGVRPERVRRLVNLEGFGLPRGEAADAPIRLGRWLHQLRQPPTLRGYASLTEVARRLRKTNHRLPPDKALWLAAQWAAEDADGQWQLRAQPAHKIISAQPYRVDEVLACWSRITAPLLWVDGEHTETADWWGERYPRAEFEARLAVVKRVESVRLSPSGHMVHHDQPAALASHLLRFLDSAAPTA